MLGWSLGLMSFNLVESALKGTAWLKLMLSVFIFSLSGSKKLQMFYLAMHFFCRLFCRGGNVLKSHNCRTWRNLCSHASLCKNTRGNTVRIINESCNWTQRGYPLMCKRGVTEGEKLLPHSSSCTCALWALWKQDALAVLHNTWLTLWSSRSSTGNLATATRRVGKARTS